MKNNVHNRPNSVMFRGADEVVLSSRKPLMEIQAFSPHELLADARTFQYKGNGDANGVTDRLRSVTEWDPVLAGNIITYEAKDKKRYIADGHQRLGLAKRLDDPRIKLYGFLYKEADGYSAKDVRMIAAQKNLAEGSGDAIDAAKIIREVGHDQLPTTIPRSSPVIKAGFAIGRLGDDAFALTLGGVVNPRQAEIIGNVIREDQEKQLACIQDIARYGIKGEHETRFLAEEILKTELVKEVDNDLFGERVVVQSIVPEKMQILAGTEKSLRRSENLFRALNSGQQEIESVGQNTLNTDANMTREARLRLSVGMFRENLVDRAANRDNVKGIQRARLMIKSFGVNPALLERANELALAMKNAETTLPKAIEAFRAHILEQQALQERLKNNLAKKAAKL